MDHGPLNLPLAKCSNDDSRLRERDLERLVLALVWAAPGHRVTITRDVIEDADQMVLKSDTDINGDSTLTASRA